MKRRSVMMVVVASALFLVGGWIGNAVVGGFVKDLLPSPNEPLYTTWKIAYFWILGVFVGGFLVGCICTAATMHQWGGVESLKSPPGSTTAIPVLGQLHLVSERQLNREAVREVIEGIVVDSCPNHPRLCRQILLALASGETDILRSPDVDWSGSGLTFSQRFKLQRRMRQLLIDNLRDMAIPSLQRLEQKSRIAWKSVQTTYERLTPDGRGFRAESEGDDGE